MDEQYEWVLLPEGKPFGHMVHWRLVALDVGDEQLEQLDEG